MSVHITAWDAPEADDSLFTNGFTNVDDNAQTSNLEAALRKLDEKRDKRHKSNIVWRMFQAFGRREDAP